MCHRHKRPPHTPNYHRAGGKPSIQTPATSCGWRKLRFRNRTTNAIIAEMVPTNTSTHTTSAYVEWYWSGRTASIAIVISRTTKPARGTTPRNATPYRLPQPPLKSPRRQRVASKSTKHRECALRQQHLPYFLFDGGSAPAGAGHPYLPSPYRPDCVLRCGTSGRSCPRHRL